MPNNIISIFLISSLSVLSTILGVFWAKICSYRPRIVAGAIGFSTAVMLYLGIGELFIKPMQFLPWPTVLFWFLVGMIIIAIIDWLLPHFHHRHPTNKKQESLIMMALLIAVGMIIHDFPEGFAIAGTYLNNPNWGWLVGLGVAIHNIPEEFAMALPLIITGQKKTLLILAIFSALAEPLGALLGISTREIFANWLLPMTIFAGGAMTFIAISELMPLGLRIKHLSSFIIGLIIGLISFGILASLF